MPLSEHEQRLLDQIERALYAEDPKFASNVRGARMRSRSHRRRIQGIALFVLGLLLLVAGVVLPFRPVGIPVQEDTTSATSSGPTSSFTIGAVAGIPSEPVPSDEAERAALLASASCSLTAGISP